MKKLVLLIGTLLCCAIANGRPQFIEPIRQLDANADLYQADVDGDWILARGLYTTNIDPNDPVWSFDWWEKVVVFHRAASGEWQLVQTLADQYVIFNSDEHFADPRDLVLENGVAAFSTNSGLHVFELVSGTWVRRTVVGTLERPPFDLDFDGVTRRSDRHEARGVRERSGEVAGHRFVARAGKIRRRDVPRVGVFHGVQIVAAVTSLALRHAHSR